MSSFPLRRRTALAAGAAHLLLGCGRGAPEPAVSWSGRFVGEAVSAGHRWRDRSTVPASVPTSGSSGTITRRCDVLVVGAGIAGLSAARALREAGVEDLVVLELHEQAGGNSRSHSMAGQPCPLGAHYLPVPDPDDHQLMRWMFELGLARHTLGRTVFDERYLCHSPQERVWHDGQWHEGLMPPVEPGTPGHAQSLLLSRHVAQLSQELRFSMPSTSLEWQPGHDQLDRQSFARWLDERGIDDPLLRWYLDYCCLDDYGAPADVVSAWAGIHYFASRHGFHAPGAESDRAADAVLTWPEGNQWLARRLYEPLGTRLKTGWMATQLDERRDRVRVLAQQIQQGQWTTDGAASAPTTGTDIEVWEARQVILALPLSWANRLTGARHKLLARAAASIQSAPWLVANLRVDGPLIERPGTPAAWDNVVAGRSALGYVDAHHQSLGSRGSELLITAYHALPISDRGALLQRSWQDWSRWVVDELEAIHADLPSKVKQVDLARHGHAMAVPSPGLRGSADLAGLRGSALSARLNLAHSDLASYSVFEEAFALGHAAGRRAAQALGAKPPRSS